MSMGRTGRGTEGREQGLKAGCERPLPCAPAPAEPPQGPGGPMWSQATGLGVGGPDFLPPRSPLSHSGLTHTPSPQPEGRRPGPVLLSPGEGTRCGFPWPPLALASGSVARCHCHLPPTPAALLFTPHPASWDLLWALGAVSLTVPALELGTPSSVRGPRCQPGPWSHADPTLRAPQDLPPPPGSCGTLRPQQPQATPPRPCPWLPYGLQLVLPPSLGELRDPAVLLPFPAALPCPHSLAGRGSPHKQSC